MSTILALSHSLQHDGGATDVAVAECEKALQLKLPPDYVQFVNLANGGEGSVGPRAYVILWRVENLASTNQAYQVETNAPGLVLFGSDGGGEGFGFDTRTSPWPVVRVPFIGMSWSLAERMGATFAEFVQELGRMS